MITHLSVLAKSFTPDALPAATFPIYPGLGQASRDTEMCLRWLGWVGKNDFWDDLYGLIESISTEERIVLGADLNEHVG